MKMQIESIDECPSINKPSFIRKVSHIIGGACMAFCVCTPFSALAKPKKAEIVVDAQTGEVLFEENSTETRYPASITKVMTLYLLFEAIENGEIALDDQLYFSKYAASQPPTKLGIKAGNSVDFETAILGLVTKSSNDVAAAIAERIGGSEAEFAKLMTSKAKELGMVNTNFANASGLPNNLQYTSAEDLAKLAIAIRRDFPREFHYFSTQNFEYNGVSLHNHNHLVGEIEGVDGLKTGYVNASGYNLATTSVRNGKVLVTVVMGGKTWRSRDERVTDLIEQSYAQLGVFSKTAQLSETNYAFSENDDEFYFANLENYVPKDSAPVKFAATKKLNPILNVVFNSLDNKASSNLKPVEKTPSDENTNTGVKVAFNDADENSSMAAEEDGEDIELRGKIDANNTKLPDFEIPAEPETPIAEIKLASFEVPNAPAGVRVDFEAAKHEEEIQKANELKAAKLEKQRQIAAHKAILEEAAKQKEMAEIAKRANALKAEKERQILAAEMRGNVVVQVGAFKSKNDAQSTIKRLSFAFPSTAKSAISAANIASGTWFRVRFSGLGLAAAKKSCEAVIRKGGVCEIITK